MVYRQSLAQLAKGLRAKEFSSVELTQLFLNRIKQYDEQINAFITVDEDNALQSAKRADELLASGKGGVLIGVPIAHKDIFCTKHCKTSAGSLMLDSYISPYDATIVARFNEAGVINVGKTNMDEFAMGSSNETSFYGACHNPWDLTRVPGGSSGGSAAAVAARLIPAATGTDTGGSIRQPAALTGITGIKPTYGRVSRYGMIAFASSFDQAGPMTQTAEDAAMMLNVMAGYDEKDSTSANRAVPDYTKNLNQPIKGLKIGLVKEHFADLNPEISEIVMSAAKVLEQQGAILSEVNLPHNSLAVPVYYVLAPAEASSNLARYDGVRYGYRCENPKDLADLYKRSRTEGFGDEVKQRIMIGTYVLSAGYYDAYYLKAQQVRRLIANDFSKAFAEVDVLLGPGAPTTAFKIGEKINDAITMYLSDIYTVAVNLAGLPAMVFPAGFSHDNLPIGLQLIGNYFDEARLLNVAHLYQQQTDWHTRIVNTFNE